VRADEKTPTSTQIGIKTSDVCNVNLPVGGVHTVECTPNGGRTWIAASVNLISGLNLTGVLPAFDGTHDILTHDHGALRYTPDR